MTSTSDAEIRGLVVAALTEADPGTVRRHAGIAAFLETGADVPVAELGLDSLGVMEFCIAVELSTGVSLVPNELRELRTLSAVVNSIRCRLP